MQICRITLHDITLHHATTHHATSQFTRYGFGDYLPESSQVTRSCTQYRAALRAWFLEKVFILYNQSARASLWTRRIGVAHYRITGKGHTDDHHFCHLPMIKYWQLKLQAFSVPLFQRNTMLKAYACLSGPAYAAQTGK